MHVAEPITLQLYSLAPVHIGKETAQASEEVPMTLAGGSDECAAPGGSGREPRAKSVSSRARQQREMQTLRTQAKELVDTLWHLRHSAECAHSQTPSPRKTDRRRVANSIRWWRQTLEKELKRVEAATRGNQELRSSLLEQRKWLRTLQHVLAARASDLRTAADELRLRTRLVLAHPSPADRLPPGHHERLQRVVAEINDMYTRANTEIAAHLARAATARGSFRQWRVQYDAANVPFAELVSWEEVPFRRSEIDAAMRSVRRLGSPDVCSHAIEVLDGRSLLVATTAFAPFATPIEPDASHIRYVSRMLSNAAYSLEVGVGFHDSAKALEVVHESVVFKARSWNVITERVTVNPMTGAEEHSSLIQVVATFSPAAAARAFKEPWSAKFIEEVVIPGWDHLITRSIRRLENDLIDAHLHGPRAPSLLDAMVVGTSS